jgi:hypothetical protein
MSASGVLNPLSLFSRWHCGPVGFAYRGDGLGLELAGHCIAARLTAGGAVDGVSPTGVGRQRCAQGSFRRSEVCGCGHRRTPFGILDWLCIQRIAPGGAVSPVSSYIILVHKMTGPPRRGDRPIQMTAQVVTDRPGSAREPRRQRVRPLMRWCSDPTSLAMTSPRRPSGPVRIRWRATNV